MEEQPKKQERETEMITDAKPYTDLFKKLDESKAGPEQKKMLGLRILSAMFSESTYNAEFVLKFERERERLMSRTGLDFSSVSRTKLKLFEQATETYIPSMCDSSIMGTMNAYYLRQIDTLFTDKVYQVDDYGEIDFVLWNLNDQDDMNGIEYTDLADALNLEFKTWQEGKEGHWDKLVKRFIKHRAGRRYGTWENTFNSEGIFTLQYLFFDIGESHFIALEIHLGGDVRGGYSDPVFYEVCPVEAEGFPQILGGFSDIQYYCPECGEIEENSCDLEHVEYDEKKRVHRCTREMKPKTKRRPCNGRVELDVYRMEDTLFWGDDTDERSSPDYWKKTYAVERATIPRILWGQSDYRFRCPDCGWGTDSLRGLKAGFYGDPQFDGIHWRCRTDIFYVPLWRRVLRNIRERLFGVPICRSEIIVEVHN